MKENQLLNWEFMAEAFPKILKGVPATMSIALVAFMIGTLIGLLVALCKIYKVPALRRAADVYTSFMRGTPLIVQIFLCYYGIPMVLRHWNALYGWNLNVSGIPAIAFMYVCYSLNAGAYLSETIRAAILSVDSGQIEAAQSIGMTGSQSFLRIVAPQAAQVALPNMANTFVSLLKDTSLAFAASVAEIMGQAKITAARTSNFFEAYIVAAIIYWVICIAFGYLFVYLEGYLRRHRKEVVRD